MTRFVATLATAALIGAFGATLTGHNASAADQRYTMAACGDAKPCAFVLDTQTGEIRYCDTAGCRILDAVDVAEKPSPFPFGNQVPVITPGQTVEPFPLGEMSPAEPGVVDQLNLPPATTGGPSPFPYVEPAPRQQ